MSSITNLAIAVCHLQTTVNSFILHFVFLCIVMVSHVNKNEKALQVF